MEGATLVGVIEPLMVKIPAPKLLGNAAQQVNLPFS